MENWFASIPKLRKTVLVALCCFSVLLLTYLCYVAWGYWISIEQAKMLPKDIFTIKNDFIKTVAQVMGGAFFLFTLYFTWANLLSTQEKNITSLYTKAIEQLGNDKLEIQLGGIYALERIAMDSKKDHWPIMEILTNYVRVHAPLIDDKNLNEDQPPKKTLNDILKYQRENPSRDQIIGSDSPQPVIQAILTVIGRRKLYYQRGENDRLNLRETNLRWLKLEEAHLEGAFLQFTDLTGAILIGAHLEKAYLFKTKMRNANLDGAHLEGVDLSHTEGLERGQLSRAIIDKNTRLPEFPEDD